ncbi:PepSY-like domain-containing protein [Mucilaginibacter sp. UYCu711]|uniref:PepSY-like domain-containing protein n=1 Tax=Mucilaginibacter sp. UYCu711 TaxID=3156339 RepID=UPI003D1C77D8
MKKIFFNTAICCLLLTGMVVAQKVKNSHVPAAAVKALMQKYPAAAKINWEKEHGNYEANWGGKSGEDMSVMFTPAGAFVEQVEAIAVSALPAGIATYVKANYKGAKITEAGKVTNAKGTVMYEAEVKGKDLIFNEKGGFLKVD